MYTFHEHHNNLLKPFKAVVEKRPLYGIVQTYCKECGRWGYVSTQRDRDTGLWRVIGQGHFGASRVFNGLPVYGLLMLLDEEGWQMEEHREYISELYQVGEECVQLYGYHDYSIVPIFREDFRIVRSIDREEAEGRLEVYGQIMAPLYRGITRKDFDLRLGSHFKSLLMGFTNPVTQIERLNLGGPVHEE